MPVPLIERYRDRLSLEAGDPVVTLNEGSTPLIHSPRLSERIGAEVYLKFEGANPTGSFKDRGMTVAVSRAKGEGAEAVICASTGNTAASAAAYAARAGLRGAVIVPEGKIAVGKLAQALMHGARVIALQGNFDQALEIVRKLADDHPVELVNSVNPYRIEGQKTAAFEVCDELGEPPDALAIPVGNAGNVTAYWAGFQDYGAAPILYGFQAEGAAPLVEGHPIEDPETVASAIRIGNPARWEEAMNAFTASRGRVAAVSDEQILEAYRLLASTEGVFCEPASAASVAGVLAHGLPRRGGRRAAQDRRLRAHRPRPQGPRHRARQGARRDRLRARPGGGREGGLRLSRRQLLRQRSRGLRVVFRRQSRRGQGGEDGAVQVDEGHGGVTKQAKQMQDQQQRDAGYKPGMGGSMAQMGDMLGQANEQLKELNEPVGRPATACSPRASRPGRDRRPRRARARRPVVQPGHRHGDPRPGPRALPGQQPVHGPERRHAGARREPAGQGGPDDPAKIAIDWDGAAGARARRGPARCRRRPTPVPAPSRQRRRRAATRSPSSSAW